MKYILLVDDCELNLEVTKAMIEGFLPGVECHTVANPDHAVMMANRMEPDLIVTDFDMPEMTGVEFTQSIKRTLPKTPVLMLSGSFGVKKKFLDAGGHSFHEKPGTTGLLIEIGRLLKLSAKKAA